MSLVIGAYGGGTNSKALGIGVVERGIKVDAWLFADTGRPGQESERRRTYEDIEFMSKWFVSKGYPPIITVRATDKTLEQDCLNRGALPAIAYGRKACSDRWKIKPQEKWMKAWEPVAAEWANGERITKFVGYDTSEPWRIKDQDDDRFIVRYPLVEWGYNRQDCERIILAAGMKLPGKSSCFFCPNMKQHEVIQLLKEEPDKLERALEMERRAMPNIESPDIKGLGRSFNWNALIDFYKRQGQLFPDVEEIEEDERPCGCYVG